jgi:hypothetical protein
MENLYKVTATKIINYEMEVVAKSSAEAVDIARGLSEQELTQVGEELTVDYADKV